MFVIGVYIIFSVLGNGWKDEIVILRYFNVIYIEEFVLVFVRNEVCCWV